MRGWITHRKIYVLLYITLLIFTGSSVFLLSDASSLEAEVVTSTYGTISHGSDSRWLRTDGKWIVDGDGNIVILRGANFMGYEWGDLKSHTFEDYDRMKSWGFNVVRLPISWNYIEPEVGVYDGSYFTAIDRDVAWAKQVGMYVVLDMHQWRWSPHFYAKGNGMPVWLVSGYESSDEGWKQAVTDFWLAKAPNGTQATLNNPSMQDRYIDAWKHVAARYANEPTIAAYDIFNEPPRGGILTTQEMSSYLYSFYESLIHEIREIDKNRIIIYENVIGVDTQYAQLLNYPNLIFSFHYYEYAQYGRAPPYDYTASFGDLENYLLDWYLSKPSNNPVEDWNIPIWVGEFGSGIEAWVRDTTSLWNKYGLGWTWWIYWKSDEKSHALLYSNGTEREHLTKYLKQT